MVIAEVVVTIAALVAGWYVLTPLFKPSDQAEPDRPDGDARSRRTEALQAILELEDDLEMGKLTEDDFVDLKSRYESDAIDALRAEQRFLADEEALEKEIAMAKRRL